MLHISRKLHYEKDLYSLDEKEIKLKKTQHYTFELPVVHTPLADGNKKYPEYDILVVSHVGFQTSDDYVNAGRLKLHPDFYNLNDQIQHKV
ncbi:hypothetical protein METBISCDRAFT_28957 [Metschnikowia bicuspidata]|uniref:Uncharacterized protein n=1 Tax=Metschnikowia bicuspidata TaxID=27322 RepID=A0A4P9Z809_9ASCO|nr:hypothetical protein METBISCDRAFT_28957 [Metschnikowia bicuspidata]